jgi:polar amino acid transport system substrate-binding protein
MLAAILGLGLNYSAYEAENYRAGIQSIPRTQMEAALALGMTRLQALRHVIVPQAMRLVLPPVTNDFIALLKDSSLVSVITMVELTRAYSQLAALHYDYLGIGLLAAAMYFLIGLPFVRLARAAERRFAPGRRSARGAAR